MAEERAVIYTRVSTGEQVETGTSLEGQELACLRKAAEMGLKVVGVFSDPGVSGGLFLSRPGIQAALKAIADGHASRLVIAKLDRAGRDVDALRDIKRLVEQDGGQIVFADGMNFQNNATGKLMFTQLAGFAEYEKELIRERTMDGTRRMAERGVQPKRNSPFGYHIVNKADIIRGDYPADQIGTYVIVEEQAAIVRELFARYAAGQSLRDLARYMADTGAPPVRGGGVWYRCSIIGILCNRAYMGEPAFGRTTCQTTESIDRDGKAHKRFLIKQTQHPEKIVTFSSPPIVDRETFEAVQARRLTNKALSGNPSVRYLLTGLFFCPVCGRKMTGRGGKEDLKRRYYLCRVANVWQEPGLPTCLRNNYQMDKADRAVINAVLELVREPRWLQSAVDAYNAAQRGAQTESGEAAIRERLAELDRKERLTAQAQVDALMQGRSTAVYDTMLAELHGERKKLTDRLAEIAAPTVAPALDAQTIAQKHRAVLAAVEAVFTAPELTIAERNRALCMIVRRVEPILDGEIKNTFKVTTVYNTSVYCTVDGIFKAEISVKQLAA